MPPLPPWLPLLAMLLSQQLLCSRPPQRPPPLRPPSPQPPRRPQPRPPSAAILFLLSVHVLSFPSRRSSRGPRLACPWCGAARCHLLRSFLWLPPQSRSRPRANCRLHGLAAGRVSGAVDLTRIPDSPPHGRPFLNLPTVLVAAAFPVPFLGSCAAWGPQPFSSCVAAVPLFAAWGSDARTFCGACAFASAFAWLCACSRPWFS